MFGMLGLGPNPPTAPSVVALLTVAAVIAGTCLWAVPLAIALIDVLWEGLLGWKTSKRSPLAIAAAALVAYLMAFLPWQILDLFVDSTNFGPLGREFTVTVWGWGSSAAWLMAFAASGWVMLARPVALRTRLMV
jgi:hypothetical protein